MRSTVVLFSLSSLLAIACGGSQSTSQTTETEPAASPPADPDPVADPPREEEPEAAVAPPSGPAPELVVRGTPDRHGSIAIAIENHGTTLARVARDVRVEVERDGAWSEVPSTHVTARPDCEHEAPECQDLAPGAALAPPDWLGTAGDAQCICTRCAPVPAGRYRLVARTCDGAHAIASAPFELSAR